MTDECAEMIDNVQFVDELEDEADIIDGIASDLLANVSCEWEKADQEYLGVSSSEDHHHDPEIFFDNTLDIDIPFDSNQESVFILQKRKTALQPLTKLIIN